MSNDIYAIAGRVKNHIAREDIALSTVGNILVNSYVHVLVDLYLFAEVLPPPYKNELKNLLISKEEMPKNVIKLSTPKDTYMTLYEEVLKTKARFDTNEEALDHFIKEYEDLGQKHGRDGYEFWLEAENSSILTEDHRAIMRLKRSIDMCHYLIKKAQNSTDNG